MLGRDFVDAGRAKRARQPWCILSYEGWQTFFARRPEVVGKTLRIGGEPATVIGVLPPGMRFPRIALAPTIAFQEAAGTRSSCFSEPLVPSDCDLKTDMGNFNYKVIARLKPGVTLAQANAELEALQQAYTHLRASAPSFRNRSYAAGQRCRHRASAERCGCCLRRWAGCC